VSLISSGSGTGSGSATKEELYEQLLVYISKICNTLIQRSPEWEQDKIFTIGGSSAKDFFDVKCPPKSIVQEKLGIVTRFSGNHYTHWGNLFEPVIETYISQDLKCDVLASNRYIKGSLEGTSYSPDGLTVLHLNDKWQITLLEFKCPFSRVPTGIVPKAYVQQLLFGLDLIRLPTVGLYAEAVFRVSTWDDLSFDNDKYISYEKQLLPCGSKISAIGFVCFLLSESNKRFCDELLDHHGAFGDASNDYEFSDLGRSNELMFKRVLQAFDAKVITAYYGTVIMSADAANANDILDADMAKFRTLAKSTNSQIVGMLPYKLFYIDYITVDPEYGIIQKNYPVIKETIDFIRDNCNAPPEEKKRKYYARYENGVDPSEDNSPMQPWEREPVITFR
jgi:hypothetical protein